MKRRDNPKLRIPIGKPTVAIEPDSRKSRDTKRVKERYRKEIEDGVLEYYQEKEETDETDQGDEG